MPSINSWAKLPKNGRAGCILALAVICLLVLNERALGAAAVPPAAPFSRERILIIPKAGRDAALANQHAGEKVKIKKKFPASATSTSSNCRPALTQRLSWNVTVAAVMLNQPT